ncbi:VHL beta domain-containing protein [Actinoplanes subglobosus]|uniref:von Hippel-Lindau disease tumour suppressor beta domain-containing protein n=1 Tax=Actinoplanes subglobosus TaxID=1547892 RepID=A0ABV8J0B2_9ACTN
MTPADDAPPETGLRIGRWVPAETGNVHGGGPRRHAGRPTRTRHEPEVAGVPAGRTPPGPPHRPARLPRVQRRILAAGLTGLLFAGSAAALTWPGAEPVDRHADPISAGAETPARPVPDPDETATPAASSATTGSRQPSWPSSTAPRPMAPSPTVPAVPSATRASAEVIVLSPLRERYLRSRESRQQTEIDFVNRRDEPVLIHWLDYHGARERYDILRSGEARQQSTYVSHPWVVTDVRGHGLAIFLPASRPAQATIT